MQASFGNKSIFNTFDDVFAATLKSLTTYVVNTKTFMEGVKVIFKQKGFVASGLKTSVKVALKPVSFNTAI
jgi:hypothetical protein